MKNRKDFYKFVAKHGVEATGAHCNGLGVSTIYKALQDPRRHYISDNDAGQQALFRVDGVVEIKPHRNKGS